MRRAVAFGALLVLACASGAPAAPRVVASVGDQIKEKERQVEAARTRLHSKRVELKFQEVRQADLQSQLAQTNAQIAYVNANIDQLDVQVAWSRRKLAWNQVQLNAAQTTLKRHNDELKRRLVDAYERGDMGYLNVLLTATSFNDFVERWDDIRYLIAANERTVRERRDAERLVAKAQQRLEAEKSSLESELARREQDHYQLASLASERSQLLVVADANRRSVAHEVADLENLTAAEEATLEGLIREKQREEEARREEERRAAQLAGRAIPPEVTAGGPGSLSWPVSGPITSPFGMRADPVGPGFRMHTGIDIGAPMGATITAAAGGRVIFAGWYGGYGNAIILDHGGQTSTLYGHCSQIFVANGQEVQRGQAIGAVGATGDATGPHLHFEVRINGVPVDPAGHLH